MANHIAGRRAVHKDEADDRARPLCRRDVQGLSSTVRPEASFGQAWQLEDEGWRKLTSRFGVFSSCPCLERNRLANAEHGRLGELGVFGLVGLTYVHDDRSR